MFFSRFGSVLCVAPHADDETIGCGGLLARLSFEDVQTKCVLVTSPRPSSDYTKEICSQKHQEFLAASKILGISKSCSLGLEPARVEEAPLVQLVKAIGAEIEEFKPEAVLLPWLYDAHSDHRIVAQAALASLKWFRQKGVRMILMYEVVSETDQAFHHAFKPNLFVDISQFLDKKVEALDCYQSEIGIHPFPRSKESTRARALLHGASCGVEFAEAFILVRGLS